MGAALFNLNCARCHTLGWSYGEPEAPGAGAFGPSMANELDQFPTTRDNGQPGGMSEEQIDWVTNGRARDEKYGRQGLSSGRMPFFGQVLTAEQIEQILAYERLLATRMSEAG
jgi:mono/diheme cytochrome c family protein